MNSPSVSTRGGTPSTPGDTPARVSRQDVRVVSAKKSVGTRLVEIWRYRELLVSLVRKELKVKYKGSVLGFAWSMLNPALTLAIFYIVFQVLLPNGIPTFAIFLLSGLLVWNVFSQSLAAAVGSVSGNGAIVKKVAFPREVLPLAAVGAALFNGLLQSIVMVLGLLFFQHEPSWGYLCLLPVAVAVLTLLSASLGIFLAAVNVKFRDTQHLLDVALSLWFWLTPIVYQLGGRISKGLEDNNLGWLYFANPVTPIVLTFQRAFYNDRDPVNEKGEIVNVLPHYDLSWYLTHLGIVALVSTVILFIGLRVFGKLEGNFAEEL
jgi:ABC-2 type transport system permease protein